MYIKRTCSQLKEKMGNSNKQFKETKKLYLIHVYCCKSGIAIFALGVFEFVVCFLNRIFFKNQIEFYKDIIEEE